MNYYKELDGLRFFAILLVIIHHWLPKNHLFNFSPNGAIGVTIFFVLSGFLISSILFGYKDKINVGKLTLSRALRIFFIRRSLRIFPIYYILIGFLFFYGYDAITQNIFYFLTYTSNILFFEKQSFFGTVTHLWTLAVEEQYYLIWPFLLFLISNKYIRLVIISLIFFSIISQFIMKKDFFYYELLTFNAFDAFGIGSLLAYYKNYKISKIIKLRNFLWIFSSAFIILSTINYQIFSTRTITSVFTGLLILYVIDERYSGSFLNKILSIKPVMFIGKISYGMYLFHPFIHGLMDSVYNRLPLDNQNIFYPAFIFLTSFGVLIIISSISWFLIESPINSLKNKFQILDSRNKPAIV
ncbi:acyltransferase [Gramella sp. AN32]|uniref:Acyltransferase family protein n=1 Tax=Christiangramia antarctica TaxID=2058158 RepID=A0ABW5X2F0_9FLAO|nr:acyltransferase [Gramella sp. AN32]MCM4157111.1 hypothetical protein [Gramella sp. AN32]